MKKFFIILIGFLPVGINAQTVTAIATNNGMAPIPAFGLGKPAGLLFFSAPLSEHVEFAPDGTFSLKDGRLWFADFWLKYNAHLDTAKKWTVTIGADPISYFGQPFTAKGGEQIDQIVRYPTGQLRLKYAMNATSLFTLDYWYTQAVEKEYGVRGHYLSFAYGWTKTYKVFALNSNPNVFYLSYSDGTKGIATSIDFNITHNASGLFMGTQVLLPVTATNVLFTWNLSVGVTRNIHFSK